MAKRIKIEFISNPTPTVDILFGVNYTPFSFTLNATIGIDVVIGATKEDTASNLYDFYTGEVLPVWLEAFTTISLASNIIYFDFEPDNDSNLTFFRVGSTSSDVTIEEVEIPAGGDYEIGLVRSTLSVRIIPNLNYDTTTLDLYNWGGDITNVPATPSYALSKSVVQLGQPVMNFDVNELSKTGINPTIANYTLTGLQTMPFEQSCWSYYVANCFDGDDVVYTKEGIYLCLYGYGYFQDLYNPQPTSNVLIDGNSHTHLRGYDNRAHFLTKDLTTLTVNGSGVTVTANTDLNYENIMSVNLNDYDSSATTITLVFTYPTETRTVVYTVKEECKYKVVNCVFINKYGLPQSLFFTKAQKRGDDIESSEYRGLISDFGVYNSASHTYKAFNSNGRTKVTCNTDYLNESENETFRQLMLSESIWLIEDGVINPVSLDKKTIEYKTSLVDKLIMYTVDFKYSFDIINQC
jgi:sulfur transfer complex TusBCD TusB component (DsrH family)